MECPLISIIVAVYRNEATLAELHRRITTAMANAGRSYEIIFVDDASDDDSVDEIHALMSRDANVRLLSLSRNRGQQEAVLAGLKIAQGELVATLDADLQDPPEALAMLMSQIGDSVDVVFAGRRGDYESAARLRVSRLFKRLLGRLTTLPPDAGMFVVMKKQTMRMILREAPRPFYLPTALIATTNHVVSVPVERARRPEGVSQYTWRGRARVGIAAVVGALRWRLRRSAREI